MAATNGKTVLSLGAHPDDAEFLCAGTLALLHKKGWNIHIATMAPGDCGTVQYSREEISRIRKGEAAKSAALLDGSYHCLFALHRLDITQPLRRSGVMRQQAAMVLLLRVQTRAPAEIYDCVRTVRDVIPRP